MLLTETYAKRSTEQEIIMSNDYWFNCNHYYRKDSNGRFYQTEQDEVIEVTTEEELNYINYTEEFMRVRKSHVLSKMRVYNAKNLSRFSKTSCY